MVRGLNAILIKTNWKLKSFAQRKEGLIIGDLKYLRGCHVKDALNIFYVTARAKINDNHWKAEGGRFWLKSLSINRGTSKIRLGFLLDNPDITVSHRIYLQTIFNVIMTEYYIHPIEGQITQQFLGYFKVLRFHLSIAILI